MSALNRLRKHLAKSAIGSFMSYDLAFFDHQTKKIEPIPIPLEVSPFDQNVLPMSQE